MKRNMLIAATFFCLAVCLMLGSALAQTMEEPKETTVTGCLQKGDQANEFKLTAEDGKRYELLGSTDLAAHVGHKITVTGTPTTETAHASEAAADEGTHLKVSKVQMVSTSCK